MKPKMANHFSTGPSPSGSPEDGLTELSFLWDRFQILPGLENRSPVFRIGENPFSLLVALAVLEDVG